MKVIEIHHEDEFDALRHDWNALLARSRSGSTFLSWEWLNAWWKAYGSLGDLRILAAFDENGVLRGLAPLRYQVLHKYGLSIPALRFIGDGSNDSDYLDFILEQDSEQAVMEAFVPFLEAALDQGTILLLHEVPATSPSLLLLQALAPHKLLWQRDDVPCGTVMLPENWDDYLKLLKPRFRTKVRAVLRHLEGRADVRFGFCTSAEGSARLLPALFDLHARRWRHEGKPGVFGWAQKRAFYATLSPLLLESDRLRFSWLEWRGKVLACQYGFVYGDRYFHLQEGYEPASESWNVGIGLRAWTIREFLKQGICEYDFLGGIGRHKTDWGAEAKFSKQIAISRRTPRTVLYCVGPRWGARARASVANIIPERLLAARRARVGHLGMNVAVKEWLRKSAAACYFHSGLPAVVRHVRDKYRVSIGRGAKWSAVSWKRREEGSARILYYHRVNDENDPFFPALPTAVFEQQMRYVARYYNVVSLAEAVQSLQSGTAENLLAITFDDGYQDNYSHAFPILQRYQLPATIFLTTGGMDAQEPLWFETLALAFKHTQRDFIDLEIDLPRRLWTRTRAERLEANDTVFRILRNLPHADARCRLEEVLTHLGRPDTAERIGKMLTWDQIRLMKSARIDFGGHTVTHPFLSKLPPDQERWEIRECKRRIEEEVQSPVHYFAYPNGRTEDFAEHNPQTLRDAGYRGAVTTMWGLNYHSTDHMLLRRGQPWEENPALFAYKLDWYQFANQ